MHAGGSGTGVAAMVQPPLAWVFGWKSNGMVRFSLTLKKLLPSTVRKLKLAVAISSLVAPQEAGHTPESRAKEAAPPLNPVRQLGIVALVLGEFAELVRSKVRPIQVTEKLMKLLMSGSYVNDPFVGSVPVPVKLIVYVVASIVSAMATEAQNAVTRSAPIHNWRCITFTHRKRSRY